MTLAVRIHFGWLKSARYTLKRTSKVGRIVTRYLNHQVGSYSFKRNSLLDSYHNWSQLTLLLTAQHLQHVVQQSHAVPFGPQCLASHSSLESNSSLCLLKHWQSKSLTSAFSSSPITKNTCSKMQSYLDFLSWGVLLQPMITATRLYSSHSTWTPHQELSSSSRLRDNYTGSPSCW